jgi:hypothetical protein
MRERESRSFLGRHAYFKAHYRQQFLRKVIERDTTDLSNIYHINQLEAMKLTARAWDAVVPSTIANCWCHTGICPPNLFPIAESLALEDSVMADLQAYLDMFGQAIGAQSFSAQDLVDVDRNIDTEEELHQEKVDFLLHTRYLFPPISPNFSDCLDFIGFHHFQNLKSWKS